VVWWSEVWWDVGCLGGSALGRAKDFVKAIGCSTVVGGGDEVAWGERITVG